MPKEVVNSAKRPAALHPKENANARIVKVSNALRTVTDGYCLVTYKPSIPFMDELQPVPMHRSLPLIRAD